MINSVYQIKSVLDCGQTSSDVWVRNGTNERKAEMEVANLKMVSLSMEASRLNKIKMNKYEENSTFGKNKKQDKAEEIKMVWEHSVKVKSYVGRRMMEIDQPNKRKRKRPKRRLVVVVKDNLEVVSLTVEKVTN